MPIPVMNVDRVIDEELIKHQNVLAVDKSGKLLPFEFTKACILPNIKATILKYKIKEEPATK